MFRIGPFRTHMWEVIQEMLEELLSASFETTNDCLNYGILHLSWLMDIAFT